MSAELFLTHNVDRQYNTPTVWVFGCSVAHGIGLDNPQTQVFGQLVADSLGMNYQAVTRPGSSAHWSLTHLLHANINPDDLIVWSVTYPERFRWAKSYDQIDDHGVNRALMIKPEHLRWFTDSQLYFLHQDIINTGVRYLTATQSRFVFTTFIEASPYKDLIEKNLTNYKQWCQIGGWNDYDFGNDQRHPGPIGHQEFAKSIINHTKLLGYS
jgi:hypothetical protein